LKGSLRNHKWCLEEPFVKGSLRHLYRFFEELLRKWFFREPWFERFFVEPEMVLLWHHSEETFLVPDGTSMSLCVRAWVLMEILEDWIHLGP